MPVLPKPTNQTIALYAALPVSLPYGEADLQYLRNTAMNRKANYNLFAIPKANGKLRLIEAPKPELKKVQRALLPLLRDVPRSPYVFGLGGQTKDAVRNGTRHYGRKVIVKMDIKMFFPSTTLSQYMHAIHQQFHIGAIALETLDLLDAATNLMFVWDPYKQEVRLPTGAPTSPLVSSICFGEADNELAQAANFVGFQYTRYMDDLTFSGYKYPEKLQRIVNKIVEKQGYKINHKKSQVLYRDNHPQIVTGVGINGPPGVGKAYKRRLRAELDHAARIAPELDSKLSPDMLGKLNYVRMVNPSQYEGFLKYFQKRQERWKEIHASEATKEDWKEHVKIL